MEKKFYSTKIYDTVLFETQNFTVVPSLGSLIEGWVLITPKEECLNFSLLDQSKFHELEDLINEIKVFQNSIYGSSILFEHGPSKICSKTGCGVDYAHLHMVPFGQDLLNGFGRFLNINLEWQRIKGISEISAINKIGKDYLYYRTPDNSSFLTIQDEFPSQVFRQIIAYYLNIPERYNWKSYPELDVVAKTIRKYELLKVSHEY
jgi:diadenosine tetraphosphate (Ap4A) HIT family hydrolase